MEKRRAQSRARRQFQEAEFSGDSGFKTEFKGS